MNYHTRKLYERARREGYGAQQALRIAKTAEEFNGRDDVRLRAEPEDESYFDAYVKTWDGIPINCTADRTDETPEGYTYQVAIIPAFASPSEEQLANARLIAAAPELLDLLRAAAKRVEIANNEGNPILSAWLVDAKAAIEKATGVQS